SASRQSPRGPDRHRGGRGPRGLRRLADGSHRRPRHPAARRARAAGPHVSRVSPARRARLATARSRRPQGGASRMTSIAEKLPVFTLPATDGSSHSFPFEGAVTVVAFTCNHCPYALAWHERLLAVARDYEAQGVRLLLV